MPLAPVDITCNDLWPVSAFLQEMTRNLLQCWPWHLKIELRSIGPKFTISRIILAKAFLLQELHALQNLA